MGRLSAARPGVLAPAPGLTDDMARLGDHGSSVAHNPESNMRLGSGLADTRAMLERRGDLRNGPHREDCAGHQNKYEAVRLGPFCSQGHGPASAPSATTPAPRPAAHP